MYVACIVNDCPPPMGRASIMKYFVSFLFSMLDICA